MARRLVSAKPEPKQMVVCRCRVCGHILAVIPQGPIVPRDSFPDCTNCVQALGHMLRMACGTLAVADN
jgi:hypothetical protein